MDVPRLLRAKRERKWDQFEVGAAGKRCSGAAGQRASGPAAQQRSRAFLGLAGLQPFVDDAVTQVSTCCLCRPRQVEELRGRVIGIVG